MSPSVEGSLDDFTHVHHITISDRFSGPDGSANGGYMCGALAEAITFDPEITLRRPMPLSTPATLTSGHARALLTCAGEVVAEALARKLDAALPVAVSFEQAVAASASFLGFREHGYPNCFVCGPARRGNQGMRVFAGPLAEKSGLVAAPWVPASDLADENGSVLERFVWAALDCPGAFAVTGRRWRPLLLGRFAARITRRVVRGERYVLMGWPLTSEGRKHKAGTAIFDAAGDACAYAEALWIEPRPSADAISS